MMHAVFTYFADFFQFYLFFPLGNVPMFLSPGTNTNWIFLFSFYPQLTTKQMSKQPNKLKQNQHRQESGTNGSSITYNLNICAWQMDVKKFIL